MFHAVLDTLSGPQTEPQIDSKGQITEAPVKRGAGDWARRILAGAFTGLASGAEVDPRTHRGGAALAGLGAGFAGETADLRAQDLQKRQQLQENFKNQQDASQLSSENDLRKANTAYLTMQAGNLGMQMKRFQIEADGAAVDTFNKFETALGADPQNQDLGVFPDLNAVMAYEKEHPELSKQIAGGHESGQVVAMPNMERDKDGVYHYNGVRAAVIRPEALNDTVEHYFGGADKIPGLTYLTPGKMQADGTMSDPVENTMQVSPTTHVGDFLNLLQKSSNDLALYNPALKHAQIEEAKARTKESNAAAGKDDATAEFTRSQLENGVDELGQPLQPFTGGLKARVAAQKVFSKDYVEELRKFNQAYDQMSNILGRAKAGTNTGADAITGLMTAIGVSVEPLKGKGIRINKDLIGEHAQAGGILQNMAAKLSQVSPGGIGAIVTTPQLQAYANIMDDARRSLYAQAGEEARGKFPLDFLPRGNGRPLDVNTMHLFADAYGGDLGKAARSAQTFGWQIPQASGTVQ